LNIVQAVFGAFHHFELGRELNHRGHLNAIYSTWPWARLKREGLPRSKVKTFPWVHTPETVLGRAGMLNTWMSDELSYLTALTFDEWTLRHIPECDALIALAGSCLKTGRLVQQRGGVFICDRGSTHQRYQERVIREEYLRWGIEGQVSDIRDILREEKIYDLADAITVPSSFARRSYLECGLPAAKIHVIPYGVRLENFVKCGDPPKDTFEVLFVGAVSLRKGIPYLLESFQRLKHSAKRLRVVGSMPNWMKPLLQRMPQEHVQFLGPVPQAQLPEIMSQSHVMVLPSIEEGLALVQGQALSCGCPVLASTNTGSEDLFKDGKEGFIVPICDVDALTDRLQRLADNPSLQQKMSEAALLRVRDMRGWSEYGDQWERLLMRLTSSVASAPA
jgi:starch synthase